MSRSATPADPGALRARATALLDALGYRGRADRTARARTNARRYRDASASRRFPSLALEWAWADNLDQRLELDGQPTVFGELRRWWPPRGRRPAGILVLASRTGPGKTVGAVWLASHVGGEFITAAELGELALSAEAQLVALTRAPLLVIDDLGDESTIRPTPERIRRLLKDRDGNGSTTLVTTNLLPKLFAERYGDHVFDRVEHGGGYRVIAGASRRSQKLFPVLEGIREACRVADLVEAIDAMTGLQGRAPAMRAMAELQGAFGVTEAELAAAEATRARWSEGAAIGLEGLVRGGAG